MYDVFDIFESDKVILLDMFEPIPEKSYIRFSKNETYFYELIYRLHLELKSVISMFKGDYDASRS